LNFCGRICDVESLLALLELVADGEEGLEIWGFGFFVDQVGLNVLEAGFLEEAFEFYFAETQPEIGVEFSCLFEAVLDEVEDGNAASGLEDAPGFGDGAAGMDGVVEGLAEEREIDGCVFDRDGFEVASPVFESLDALFLGEFGAVFDHFLGVIDGDDLFGALSQ